MGIATVQTTQMCEELESKALAGRTLAVPETRELNAMARMLQDHGAKVLSCPMVGILDTPNKEAVESWLRELAAGKIDDLVLMTGDGVRRLMGFAERAGIAEGVREAFARARKITRGPKPARALTEAGLRTDLPSAAPTTDGVIETLSKLDLRGRRVGVQLYGEDPNVRLIEFLKGAGAIPVPVAPYIYAPVADEERVVELIQGMASGHVDVIAFTSATQVRRLKDVAKSRAIEEKLATGFERTRVAAVGPIVAQELVTCGIRVDIIPRSSFILKQFLSDIIAALRK